MDKITRELYEVLSLIVEEFKTDPQSIICFDTRLVDRARRIVEAIQTLEQLKAVTT